MLEVNREGKLTRGQKIYLLRQFLERLGFMLLWLLIIFFVQNALRYGVGGITTFYWLLLTGFKSLGIMALMGYTAIYALDLFWTKPIKTKGILSKVQKRVGHSDQYWVEVGRHKTLTTKLIWLSLQPGAVYELLYGRWTKQLLSYEQLSTK
jgi:hypothetical protein